MKIQFQIQLLFHPRHRKFAATIVCCVGLTYLPACESRPTVSQEYPRRPLENDTVAAVGQQRLARPQLQPALDRSLDLSEFVRGWVVDTLFAEGARHGLLESARIRQTERSVLARALLEWAYNHVVADGVPTDAEIERVTAERWFAVDRPSAAKTTHFVVRVTKSGSSASAQVLARKIATSVHGISDPDAFIAAVKSFPANGAEVVAESLPPVTSDGRSIQLDKNGDPVAEGPHFDETFARAANLLESEGSQSGLVQSPFGYHVILLERKVAAKHVPLEERRRNFAPEVYARRARQLTERFVEEGKKLRPVQLEPSLQEIIVKSQVIP